MDFFTIDFETYYDVDYTLTKMSTEDYVNDPRFEIILVGVKKNNDPPVWFSGTMQETLDWLEAQGVYEGVMIAHNNMFDGMILAVHAKKLPKKLLCTRMMANPWLKPYMRSVSLDSCLKHLQLGIQKGTTVNNMKGRSRQSLTKWELKEYAAYCMDDCEGEFRLFKWLAPQFPKEEFDIIDMTLRMYLQPRMVLNAHVLAEHLQHVQAKKAQLINSLPPGITESQLSSNPQFAALLQSKGVEVPMKFSPTTGEATYALAKQDTGWKELEEEYEDDPEVYPLLMARLGAKSTLEETRTTKLLNIAKTYRRFRVPLMYYAAHPGRYGGTEGINAQNLPRIDKSRMRFAIEAPEGCVLIAADLAQIEARITAWLALQMDLVADFRVGADIYSKFATRVFKVDTVKDRSPEDKKRRFVGKTCILGLGYGMGAPKLRATLRKDGLKFSDPECQTMVDTYRQTYASIPQLWRHLDQSLRFCTTDGSQHKVGPLTFAHHAVWMPNGMPIHYHNLRYVTNGVGDKVLKNYKGYVYEYNGEFKTLWGGKVCENVVQGLARILIMQHMIEIKKQLRIRPVLQQHDELDYVAPASHAEALVEGMRAIMRTPPWWAPDLPVEVEINIGKSLGDCK